MRDRYGHQRIFGRYLFVSFCNHNAIEIVIELNLLKFRFKTINSNTNKYCSSELYLLVINHNDLVLRRTTSIIAIITDAIIVRGIC